ncbi:MAG: hypothetical protein NC210_09415 [[Clostridium] fimetarium]|nr:hypothetical protein [Alistipes timonensis]MCM1406629.1 hypothetical protein [[Clostridium] fimetarium]
MRMIEKILGVAGLMLLGMSLGVAVTAGGASRTKVRAKRKADLRVQRADAQVKAAKEQARKEIEMAAAAVVAEKARARRREKARKTR